MIFESKIWAIETISARPIYALSEWQAFECRVGRSKSRSHHFVGAPGTDINPVISGAIVRIDPGSACAATAGDKVYQLGKEVGLSPAGERLWSLWKDANKATDVVDVTDEVVKFLTVADDATEVPPRIFERLEIHKASHAMTLEESDALIREGEAPGSTAQLPEHMTFSTNYVQYQNHRVYSQEVLLRAGARRKLAGVFLRDAQRQENSLRTRADLAFEAVYLCALAALGAAADNYEHPSREALVAGARLAGLSKTQVDAIGDWLEYRYESAGSDARWQLPLDLLTTAAKTMRKAK